MAINHKRCVNTGRLSTTEVVAVALDGEGGGEGN